MKKYTLNENDTELEKNSHMVICLVGGAKEGTAAEVGKKAASSCRNTQIPF